jgi:8-oxo-dGTP pyrophosphatase MutT (NUDIX family)
VEETLKRELLEETGISSVKSTVPFTMALSNLRIPVGEESVGLILSVYICEVDIGEIRLSEEHLESKWFSPQEAADLLRFKYPEDFVEKLRTLE